MPTRMHTPYDTPRPVPPRAFLQVVVRHENMAVKTDAQLRGVAKVETSDHAGGEREGGRGLVAGRRGSCRHAPVKTQAAPLSLSNPLVAPSDVCPAGRPPARPPDAGTMHVLTLAKRQGSGARTSKWTEEKRIRVWTPPGFDAANPPPGGYPLLLMNDGQNMFEW